MRCLLLSCSTFCYLSDLYMHEYWGLLMLQLLFLLWGQAGIRLATCWRETCAKNNLFARNVLQVPRIFEGKWTLLLMYIVSNTLCLAWYTCDMKGEFHTPPYKVDLTVTVFHNNPKFVSL